MNRRIPAAIVLLLCTLAAFSVLSPSSDAETPAVPSEFTEDVAYPDNSTITIEDGAMINIGSFTWSIGANSSVIFLGAAEITCTTGKISVGENTSLTIFGTLIPGFSHPVEYTFNGTAVFSGTSSQTEPAVSFANAGTVLSASWTDSKMEITDFKMYQEASGDDIARIVGFSAFKYTGSVYDGTKLVSTKTIEVDAGDKDKTISGNIHVSEGSADVTLGTLDTVKITSSYTESEMTSIVTLKQVTSGQASIATTKMAHITATVSEMDTVKTIGGKEDSSTVMKDISIDTNLNIRTLFIIILRGVEGTSPDWLEDLKITAGSCTINDSSLETSKTLTDLSFSIDYDGAEYLKAVAHDGDAVYTVTTTSAVFTRFDLDRHLELSTEVTVGSLIVQKETSGSLTSKISFNNLRLTTEDLELKSFTMMYSRTGTKLIQHLLDSSNRFDLKADSFTLDNNGDGVNDASSESLSVILSTNTQKLYTMAAECTSFSGSVPLAGHNATITLGRTGLYIESSGSMSQCIDFLISGSDFTSDAHAEICVNYSGFSLSYPINDGSVSFTDKQASATTPPDSTMMVSLDHSEIRKTTTLSGRLNYIGHSFTAELHKTYAEPSGALDLLLKSHDGSMSFEFEFGSNIAFTLNMNLPWTFELQYYGISVQADAGVSTLSLSRGKLDLEGFDIETTGAVHIPFLLSQKDFSLETRLAMEVGSLSVYTDNRTALRTSISDMELEVKKISAELRHGVKAAALLQKISATYVDSQGNTVSKELGSLNLSKDLVPASEEKGLLEKAMVWILVASVIGTFVLCALFIRIRIKEPELFRLNEHTSAEEVPSTEESNEPDAPKE